MNWFTRLGPNSRGILLMIVTVFFFTLMDVMGKAIAHRTDTVMALWARYTGQTTVVLLLVLPRMRSVLHTRYPGLQLLRSVFLLCATCCFFFGFVLIGLANAAAIMSVNPVLITLGAAIFLGERFGVRRAAGVGAALIGALIIIRPGSEVFSPYAVFPFAAAIMLPRPSSITRLPPRLQLTTTPVSANARVSSSRLSKSTCRSSMGSRARRAALPERWISGTKSASRRKNNRSRTTWNLPRIASSASKTRSDDT